MKGVIPPTNIIFIAKELTFTFYMLLKKFIQRRVMTFIYTLLFKVYNKVHVHLMSLVLVDTHAQLLSPQPGLCIVHCRATNRNSFLSVLPCLVCLACCRGQTVYTFTALFTTIPICREGKQELYSQLPEGGRRLILLETLSITLKQLLT